VPPNFYNAGDQAIYSAGDFFIPQERYRAAPYTVNQPTNPDEVPAGIPTVYRPQGNMTGGALQAGDINYDSFAKAGFDAYANRQPSPLVDDLYQSKLDKTFMGFPSYQQQQLTGPDMGEYIASNTDVPLELTTAGKIQNTLGDMGKGITGLANKIGGIGPISMLLGSMDKFDTLPELDQQFIKENMGYRGPTVFGENSSGLYKDPFGVNTRSAFGNYAEKVRDEFGSLGDSLTGRLSEKYGASFNPETGMFESEDEEAAARANKMTKMMRAKYNFRQKQIEQQKFNEKIAAQQKAAEEKAYQERVAREADTAARARSQNQAVYESADRQGFTNRDGGFSTSRADRAGTSEGSGQFSSKSGRGRTGYLSGGLADMLEIYD
jgi:hypothetical protein